jgi:hypothetical protein
VKEQKRLPYSTYSGPPWLSPGERIQQTFEEILKKEKSQSSKKHVILAMGHGD